jgi:hypothetical protein
VVTVITTRLLTFAGCCVQALGQVLRVDWSQANATIYHIQMGTLRHSGHTILGAGAAFSFGQSTNTAVHKYKPHPGLGWEKAEATLWAAL